MDINQVQQEAQKWALFHKTCIEYAVKYNGSARRMNELLQKADLHGAHQLYQSTMRELCTIAEYIQKFDHLPRKHHLWDWEEDKKLEQERKQEKEKSLEQLKNTDWND